MFFLSCFLLALSSNLDNIGIGVSYGIRRIAIPFSSNLIVAVVTTLGTICAMSLGDLVARHIPPEIAAGAGSAVIAAAGVWVMLQTWIKPNGACAQAAPPVRETTKVFELRIRSLGLLIRILREPVGVDADCSGRIEGREALLLALALTVNNLAGGFGGGMVGISIPLTAGLVFLLSLLTLAYGVKFGHLYLSRWLGRWASLVAGLILVAVAVYEFFF